MDTEINFKAIAAHISAMPISWPVKLNFTEETKAAATERILKHQNKNYQFGGALARRCHCGQPCIGSSDRCRYHNGRSTKPRPPWRAFATHVQALHRKGHLPVMLTSHPVWPAMFKVIGRKDWQEPVRALVIAACEVDAGDTTAMSRFVLALSALKQRGLTW